MHTGLTSEQEHKLADFLAPSRIAVVATIGRTGLPQLTPNWYHYINGTVNISTTKERLKYRNLSHDNRLSVCIYSEPLAKDYAVVTGTATILEGEGIWPITRSIVGRYVEPDRVDSQIERMRRQNRVIISLKPEQVAFRY
ncbi:MAG: PPOX class F420-dependent oxidoreductase [Dehalococcoidia bacterium]|nr:PPOX class F420-dependent oxidoreductase [Dehalococcoidia bacterium]